MVEYKECFQEKEYKELEIVTISDFSHEEYENARILFSRESKFITSAVDRTGYPILNLKEVAFAGRSNVGKSSLINSITSVNGIARVSNTPGRTQMINFFSQDDKFLLVDLPGFGYAKASKDLIKKWKNLTYKYLQGRKELETVFFLIDSRHGIKEIDETAMDILDNAAVSYQVVLTKFDKISKDTYLKLFKSINSIINKRAAARPGIIITSSKDKNGVDLLRALIYRIINI
jgi:GTP-binding protein